MRFEELKIPGTWVIEPQQQSDRRGYFTRRFCRWELERRNLDPVLVRCRISVWPQGNAQYGPVVWSTESGGAELIRCAAGAVRLELTDLRGGDQRGSVLPSIAVELSVANRRSIYVPAGVSYRYTTMVDSTEVLVQCSELGEPASVDQSEREEDVPIAVHSQ